MKSILAIMGTLAVLTLAGSAQAGTADQGDLLAGLSTTGAVPVAPMSSTDLDGVRGEGTYTQSFDFPQLHHDFDRTFSIEGATIHIVGVAATGQITLTIDSPHIP